MAPSGKTAPDRASDREKALETALLQIERQFGKGTVMRLGEETRVPVEVIPTGSIALDVALGIGGLPRGRIVEIYGPESSGKCLVGDTYVWSDRGLETISEIFERAGLPAGCASRVTDISDLGIRLVNERGELETVAAVTHNGRKPVIRLRLASGRIISLTRNHPLRVVSEGGSIVWREAGEIRQGDTVVSARFGAVEAACGDDLAEDEAVLLGYLAAEGSLHVKTAGETVPYCVRTAGHKAQRSFLSALFEGSGWTDPSSAISLEVASEELARQVQLMLYGLAVPATVSAQDGAEDHWTVTVSPSMARRFLQEVGFRSALRAEQVRDLRDSTGGERGLPYSYEEVTGIEDAGLQPTFDVVLPRTHSFLANGILSHNTTVALHAVANAQKAGGIAAFIDAEHALDPDYAQKLGVDTDQLLVSQPDTGEQALEIADMLIRSGAIDIVVIDSVAALVPKAEIEGEMGDSHVGLQARLMSQALRKLAGALNQTKTTAVFINQLREKVGVLFGCMSYNTRVTLADGTQEKIGKIVNQRMDVEVLSYDPETGALIPRKIVNWFDNGNAERFLQFTVAKSGGNGLAQFAATENHLIRTPGGWREAGELIAGDRVLVAEKKLLSDQQVQVILGSLMGDGNLSPNRRGRNGTRFRLGHGPQQEAYLGWKVSLLGNIKHAKTVNAKGAVFADFTPLPELAELREAVYFGDGKKHLTWEYLKALTPLALAIWYMDDGCFTAGRIDICVEAMSPGSRERLVAYLRDTHKLDVKLTYRGARQKCVLQFTTASSEKFQKIVAPYVHPSMEDKLLPRFRGKFAVAAQFARPEDRLVAASILDIHVKPPTRSMKRFDIEVEGLHNYFVDGVMVHNSPETTTGGKALKFYASVRLDIRRIETLKDGTEAVGNRTKVKVVKNKCLAEGTRVCDPVSGVTRPIEEIVDGRIPVHVVSVSKAGRLEIREVASWLDQGEQDVIGLRLADDTQLWVTPDHKILTEHGWRLAGELTAGDRVARPLGFPGAGPAQPASPEQAYLSQEVVKPVIAYLEERGVSAVLAAELIGESAGNPQGGMKAVLGASRMRRDRLQLLADALDDEFLHEILADQLWFGRVTETLPARRARTFDLEVAELHNFVADDIVVHNCAAPFKNAEFDILYGIGISKEGGLIDLGVEQGIVRKAGAWYTYEGDQLGQGKENARNFLRDNPDVADEIEKKIKEKLGVGPRLDDDAPAGDAPGSPGAVPPVPTGPAARPGVTRPSGPGKPAGA